MAEHMLILGVEDPHGEKTYVAAAFPSACGKTNFAMLIPPAGMRGLEGLDRRRRHRLDQAGRRGPAARDQPRGRLLRRRAGDVGEDQPERDGDDRAEHDLHERRADARRRRVVGRHDRRAAGGVPRLAGQAVDAGDRARRPARKAAHPNARFTAPAAQCPTIDPAWEDPDGVPISAIVFGGRRATTMPLVYQAFNWSAGVYVGATMGSETTAAAAGTVGQGAARSDGDAAVLRLPHGRLLPALDQDAARAAARRRRSSTSTGSARTPTASSCGRGSARTCGC